ncbi:MAG: hypothetical protein U0T36_07890 [Saprospiraceae bacterium]
MTSTTVKSRYTSAHNNYKVTRSKTKVTGPRGNSVTKKSTTVQGRHGQVKGQKTTVKRSRSYDKLLTTLYSDECILPRGKVHFFLVFYKPFGFHF